VTPQERWSDYGRQLKRRARKAVGQPASSDVAAISTLIRDLKKATEEKLGFEIVSAAASLPRIPAIYDEDLYDAFDYVGLGYLQIISATYHHTFLTYETMAALVGHGFSVCPNVTYPDSCSVDDLQDNYYIVEYTKDSLFVYYTLARSAYYEIETAYFDLGLGNNAQFHNPDESYYWEAVRKVLLQPLLDHTSTWPSKIILVGEEGSVNDRVFSQNLFLVLKEFFGKDVPHVIDQDYQWVQSKGVAEFVRRRPYRPKPVKPETEVWKEFAIEERNSGRQKVLNDWQGRTSN
jgi:hypothetical protein